MKVLHVISGLRSGGAEHFVLELCKQSLKNKDAEMHVLSLSAADEISYKFREAGIEVRSTSYKTKNKRGINAFRGFGILLKNPGYIVHAHMYHACLIACFAKMLRPSLKIIFTLHNNNVPELHRKLFMFFTRALRKTDTIFPGMQLKWYQKSNAVSIPNGVDETRFNHIHTVKPPLFICTFIGRLSVEKNPLFLVELAKSLLPDHNFLIRVAGCGPLKSELIKRVSEEKLDDHFVIHGHVEDVAQLLAGSHCLLIPSLWEGMPLALLEAGAAGIPVIATPVGNIPTLLNNNNGFVGDTDNFRKMVTEVMDNYGEALIKARNLKQQVTENYNIMNTYRQYHQLYLQ